jgi:hypothetical protein
MSVLKMTRSSPSGPVSVAMYVCPRRMRVAMAKRYARGEPEYGG